MDVQVRSVSPARGWAWIVGGVALFLRSPVQWLLLLAILFAAKKALGAFPVAALAVVFSVLAVLLMPVFMAGLMDGCRALEIGRPLQIGHLAQGFRRNTAPLITIGGISLVGNLLIFTIFVQMGGEAMTVIMKTLSGNPVSRMNDGTEAAYAAFRKAALVSAALSLPLLLALWFAPLLAYFDDAKPLHALKLSLLACLKNALPMLVYALVLLAGLMVLVPVGIRFGEFDLGLWLMAPVLVPSIYVSYRDIFTVSEASAPPSAVQG